MCQVLKRLAELVGVFPSWREETDGTNLINVSTILSSI